MALSAIDRKLLESCLSGQNGTWEDFVDRFLGLVVHVVNHTAATRSIQLAEEDREDLTAEVFLTFLQDDFAVLRRFRGASSLATYLTVIARRVIVRELMKRKPTSSLADVSNMAGENANVEQRLSNRDEVAQLLNGLNDHEAEVVRMYHLEGKTYHEISSEVGMPENSIGPTLSRAREKLRRAEADAT